MSARRTARSKLLAAASARFYVQGVASTGIDVITADAMTVSADDLPAAPTALVANLPYNVATPLVLDLLDGLRRRQSVDAASQAGGGAGGAGLAGGLVGRAGRAHRFSSVGGWLWRCGHVSAPGRCG